MDNNQMLNLMMQMMMQNNQLMSMMMQQMVSPQTGSQTGPSLDTSAPAANPVIQFQAQGVNVDLQAQINDLQNQVKQLQSQLAAAEREKNEINQKHSSVAQELKALKSTVSKAEAYLGQTVEDVAAQGENLSGDDYYDKKKEEWDKEGVSNKERYQRTKAFKDAYKVEEDPWGPMIEF